MSKPTRILTYLFTFLFPLAFLPILPEPYDFTKVIILIVFLLAYFIFATIEGLHNGKIKWYGNAVTVCLGIIALISVISSFIQSPNLILSLTSSISTPLYISLVFLHMIVLSQNEADKEGLLTTLLTSSSLVSLYLILNHFIEWDSSLFTPSGSLLLTCAFLGIMSAVSLLRFFESLSNARRDNADGFYTRFVIGFGITSFMSIVGTYMTLERLMSDSKPILLPLSYGWQIFLTTIGTLKSVLLGIGPGNFSTAFTLGKPLGFASTSYSDILFTSSSSFLLNLGTEIGLVAFIAMIVIFLHTLTSLLSDTTSPAFTKIASIGVTLSLIYLTLAPGSATVIIMLVILLGLCDNPKAFKSFSVESDNPSKWLILILPFTLTALILWYGGKVVLAEKYFKDSQITFSKNDGTQTYNLLKQAITLNPYIDRYHSSFSRVNLALAESLAKKKSLTSEDKDNIPTLVRQSIDQAQIAVKLNRTNLSAWQTLAQTYVSLLNFVVGSENWAQSSLKQMIALDPMNPLHRISLASFYEKQNKPQLADEQYREALRISTTDPRTYYRYATFLINQKEYNRAFEYLTIALNLVAPGSENEKTITSTRKSIESMINNKNNINTINTGTLSNTVPNRDLNDRSATSSGIPEAIPTIKY